MIYLKNKMKVFFSMFFLLIAGSILAQNAFNHYLEAIQDSLTVQLLHYPQEKLYLHTDRTMYMPGENIWFKAYLIDAFSHQPLTYSLYIYVELIDSSQTIKKRVMVRRTDNMTYYGHLEIPETIAGGVYTIRSYTRFMENTGEDYFFKKNVKIGENREIEENRRKNFAYGNRGSFEGSNESFNRGINKKDDYHVSLLPEGGNLLSGVLCKVAFKAQNVSGYSEYITGEIVDEKGQSVCPVITKYAGMGSFVFAPEKNKKYSLKCKNAKGREKRFELPAAINTCSLSATSRNSNHFLTVEKSPDCPEQPLFLLIQSRGFPFYFNVWDNSQKHLAVRSSELPSGVIQFILFDGDMNPLSERLVFNKSADQAEALFKTDREAYGRRELVKVELSIKDAAGAILEGNLSVAITDDRDIKPDSMNTILSNLLLSSELKGYIENPAYYLKDNPQSEYALDLLMLTHGWRRYNIPAVIKGKYEFPKIIFEQSKGITGKVTSRVLKRPVEGSIITFATNDGSYGILETDAEGRFRMYGLDYPDSTRIILQAKNTNKKNNVNLDVDKEIYPKPVYAPDSPLLRIVGNDPAETNNREDDFIQKAAQRARYDEEMRLIELGEVSVTAKKPDPVLDYYLNAKPDYAIQREDIKKYDQKNVNRLMMNIPGVVGYYESGVYAFRLVGSNYPPVVIIDGVQQNQFEGFSPFNNIRSVDDIKEIFVVGYRKTNRFGIGPETPLGKELLHELMHDFNISGPSVVGGIDLWGDMGAIIINTFDGYAGTFIRRRHFNNVSVKPLGYQQPVEFYAPKYETPEAKNTGIPDYRTTIFWKPDLTVSDEGKACFEFFTSDFPTSYSVVIEGLSTNGKIVHQIAKIDVK